MNLLDQFEVLEIDKNMLTDKKQQTDYKIKYVSEYAKLWSIISAERNDVTEITFIDCMCNAGVYRDGDCCTAIEVSRFARHCYPKRAGQAGFGKSRLYQNG